MNPNTFYYFAITSLSYGLGSLLFITRWKKGTISTNLQKCGILNFSYFSFYKNLSFDFLSFIMGRYPRVFFLSKTSLRKLENLKKTGGILLCSHYGNWEHMGGEFVKRGLTIKGYSQELASPFFDSLLNRLRKNIGLPTISTQVSKQALEWVHAGKVFGVLWDQHSPSSKSKGTFFGQTVTQTGLPEFLYEKTGKPAVFAVPMATGEVRIVLLQSEIPQEGSSPNDKSTSRSLISRYHKCLECVIRNKPEYWYGWAHRRFKGMD